MKQSNRLRRSGLNNLNVIIRNTHFVVTASTHKHLEAINSFNKLLITFQRVYIPKLRKFIYREDRQYYYKVNNHTYHYSIHVLRSFIRRARSYGFDKHNINVSYDTGYTTPLSNIDMNANYKDRDYQTAYINQIISINPITLCGLSTGKGKTYISMRVATELKYRTGIVVLSRYIDKWVSDVKTLTTAKDDNIYVVKGRDSLIKLLDSAIKYDFVIFSLSTLRSYIKAYDNEPELYGTPPEDIFKELDLKLMLNDEVHQSFHASYMVTIRINPLKVISLSATLENLDKSISNMYLTLYPKDARCGDLVRFESYHVIIAVNYQIAGANRLRTEGPRGYNHIMFEQSMLRNGIFRKMYLDMLLHYIKVGYLNRRKKDDKLLILVQSVALATLLTNFLNVKTDSIVVNRYVEEDPYSNIIKSDIAVSTNLSSGTALDIPNLITVIQTVSIRSLQANIQALGRLREISGREVRYYYLYSSSIGKQQDLHVARKEQLRDRAKEYRYEEYNKILRAN